MPHKYITLSQHADLRSRHRNMSYDEICFAREHGHKLHNAGAIFFQLRKKDVPKDIRPNHPLRRLVGTTAFFCSCGQHVITMYRDEDAFGKDKRKTKYNTDTKACWWPCCETNDNHTA